MSRIVIGLDGGQSSTVTVAVTPDGRVIGVGKTGPSNHITEPGGPERCENAVREAVALAVADAGRTEDDVAYVLCGMTGAFDLTQQAIERALPTLSHRMVHDSVTAFHGATAGNPGVMVIGGTGSVGYGEDGTGRAVRLGGWGYLMGDEGSAYWIAIEAVKALALAIDKRGPATSLVEDIPRAVGMDDVYELHTWLYSQSDRAAIARLSRVVDKAVENGDTVATTIMTAAGERLAALAVAVVNQLAYLDEPLVSYVGGTFMSRTLRDAFSHYVTGAVPTAKVAAPRLAPAGGAALLAMHAAGWRVQPKVVARLRRDLQSRGIGV